jgi:hypothetical protein
MELPEHRVTTRFEFPQLPLKERRFWLVVQRPEPEVCVKPPGFEENLVVDGPGVACEVGDGPVDPRRGDEGAQGRGRGLPAGLSGCSGAGASTVLTR